MECPFFSARIVETLGSENFGAITFAVIFQVSISSTFFARFFRRYFGAKNYKAETFGFVIFLVPKYRRKKRAKNVDEIDSRRQK